MICIYHGIFKEVNGDKKYLSCTYLLYNNFEFLRAATTLDKVYIVCSETVREKPTGNDTGLLPTQTQFYFLVYVVVYQPSYREF